MDDLFGGGLIGGEAGGVEWGEGSGDGCSLVRCFARTGRGQEREAGNCSKRGAEDDVMWCRSVARHHITSCGRVPRLAIG